MGRTRRTPSRRNPLTRRRVTLKVDDDAAAEFIAYIRSIRHQSAQGANTVLTAVERRVRRLRQFPEAAPVDETVMGLPTGVRARKAHAAGYVIRYLYPFPMGKSRGVLVVSIRPGEMLPDDLAFYRRFTLEYARETAHPRR